MINESKVKLINRVVVLSIYMYIYTRTVISFIPTQRSLFAAHHKTLFSQTSGAVHSCNVVNKGTFRLVSCRVTGEQLMWHGFWQPSVVYDDRCRHYAQCHISMHTLKLSHYQLLLWWEINILYLTTQYHNNLIIDQHYIHMTVHPIVLACMRSLYKHYASWLICNRCFKVQ